MTYSSGVFQHSQKESL